jgi:4-hydroxybenzoate polyprenyltransferase
LSPKASAAKAKKCKKAKTQVHYYKDTELEPLRREQVSQSIGIRAWVRSLRMPNLLLVVWLFVFGAEQTGELWLCLAIIAGMLGGNWHNDWCDKQADAINRPGTNPLHDKTGRVAFLLILSPWIFTLAVAVVWWQLLPAKLLPLMLALTFAYNKKLQHIPLVGNLSIALLIALTVGMALRPDLNQRTDYYLFINLAFWTNLAREWIKTIQDRKGDKLHKRNSGAIFTDQQLKIGACFCLVFALIPSLAMDFFEYSLKSLWLAGVWLGALGTFLSVWKLSAKHCSMTLKAYMAYGLMGILLF